jgi:hypothetical protein
MRLAIVAKKIPMERRKVSPTTPVPAGKGCWLSAGGGRGWRGRDRW